MREGNGSYGAIGRRELLLGIAALAFVGCGRRDPALVARARELAERRAYPSEAARIGAAWLALAPAETDLERLLAELPEAPEAVFAAHRRDLDEGRMVEVEGWWLSATEARVYAAVHLAR